MRGRVVKMNMEDQAGRVRKMPGVALHTVSAHHHLIAAVTINWEIKAIRQADLFCFVLFAW